MQVCGVLLLFTALSAFIVDLGAQYVSRTQIQTAADSAALAGATALVAKSRSSNCSWPAGGRFGTGRPKPCGAASPPASGSVSCAQSALGRGRSNRS